MKRLFLLFALFAVTSLRAQQVAITFDDLPEHGDLPPHLTRLQVAKSILTTLKHEHMPAVYGFINAVALEDTPSEINVLRAWRAAGQPLGSHTYSHADLTATTVAKYEADIDRNELLLRRLMKNEDWRWFRYPYLREGDTLEKRDAIRSYLSQRRYRTAQVSLNFEDWAWNDPYARCSTKRDAKEIEWLHDSYLAAADRSIAQFRDLTHVLYGRDISYVLLLHIGPFDAKMLPELIALLRSRGFTFVSLPDAMSDAAYNVDPGVAAAHGLTFQEQVVAERHIRFTADTRSLERLDTVCR
jgi:peptidoglycan/xylan/chitin deacetylase (PgdA/CDA1 family)